MLQLRGSPPPSASPGPPDARAPAPSAPCVSLLACSPSFGTRYTGERPTRPTPRGVGLVGRSLAEGKEGVPGTAGRGFYTGSAPPRGISGLLLQSKLPT